jgi:hypothetical protein
MEDGIETTIRLGDMLDKKRTKKLAKSDIKALVNAGVYAIRDPDDPEGGTFYGIIHSVSPSKGEQIEKLAGEDYMKLTIRKVLYT